MEKTELTPLKSQIDSTSSSISTQPPAQNNQKLILLLIIFGLVVICGYLFWMNTQLKQVINQSTPLLVTPSPNLVQPKETVQLQEYKNSETDFSRSSDPLDNIELSYDKNKFKITKGSVYQLGTNSKVPALNLTSMDGLDTYLQFVDMSAFTQDVTELSKFLSMASEDPFDSSLRDVIVDGNVYSFSRVNFGDGGPTVDGCSEGGGIMEDYFYIKERKIGVIVTTKYAETRCDGRDPKVTNTPNSQTSDELLVVLESAKF